VSIKIPTLLAKIDSLPNSENAAIILDFYKYMQDKGSSENHIINNIKVILDLAGFLGPLRYQDIEKKDQILSFLNLKIKDSKIDSEKRWITTWNHYLNRTRLFYRWFYNAYRSQEQEKHKEIHDQLEWNTPDFVKIKQKHTKRLSPYSETEIWERDELLTIIKFEPYLRNKAILTLMWDLNARPHEITLLRIKHIRLKERYGEGEVPSEAKTGGGPILLTCSFPYVRDWLNEHPFRNEPNARLICNLYNGSPIVPKTLWNMMEQLKRRIIKILDHDELDDKEEIQKLRYLLRTKKWNPYCIRHSAITSDSDYLPDFALKKKVRWSMNSKQASRYIKNRMGDELKRQILVHNGAISDNDLQKKPSVLTCPRCSLVNAIDNKYCSKCSYPLVQSAFDEIKAAEEIKLQALKDKYENDIKTMREEMNQQLSQITSMIQQNAQLAYIKPEALVGKKIQE
jgi:integrase/recombinase XerD